MIRSPRSGRWFVRLTALLLVAAVGSACSTISRTSPAPTAADFPGIAGVFSQNGIRVDRIVSGDSGCNDIDLARTAIGFDASGLDQATPVRIRIYIFRNRATFERLRATIDTCAAAFVTDRDTFESIDQSPYVVVGQGPWGVAFRNAVRAAIGKAAGTGG